MVDEPSPKPNHYVRRSMNLNDAMEQATPKVFVTPVLMLMNILLFVVMVAFGVDYKEPATQHLIAWGASHPPLTITGEYYRLLTTTFIHIGILHLLLNMWCLFQLGFLAEKLYGNLAFAIIYLLSGLGGSVLAAIVSPTVPAAGASGAIFGLGGAWLAFVLVQKKTLSPDFYRNSIQNIGFFLGINLIFGLSVSGISNAGHIGGLILGFGSGLFLTRVLYPLIEPDARRIAQVILAATAILVGGVFLAKWRVAESGDPIAQHARNFEIFGRYLDRSNRFRVRRSTLNKRLHVIEKKLTTGKGIPVDESLAVAEGYGQIRKDMALLSTELKELQEIHSLRVNELKYLEDRCRYYHEVSKEKTEFNPEIVMELQKKSKESAKSFQKKFQALLGQHGLQLVDKP